ncbi:tetratricopeptide repeat protein 37-like isoform X1 [Actinia tenebrosa]|nr:tetratricopeptide repeat protein 37-like isoform X1 [Actinia tenebrosa]XP_031551878.1 tetratricopeptide repeat protein 37-like isoform X1 [Actinia tenebrosa]
MDQPDQAQAAYKRAIESDQDQILAWQGLASLYEKETGNPGFQEELPGIYRKLMKLYERSDMGKWKEVNLKLTNSCQKQGKIVEATEAIEQLIQLSEDTQEKYDLNLKMVALLEGQESKDVAILSKLVSVLQTLVRGEWSSASENDGIANYTKDIKTLITIQETKTGEDREGDRRLILEECRKWSNAYPNATYPLEVRGKIYLEDSISDTSAQVPDVYQTLCHLDPSSAVGKIGLGWSLLNKNDFIDARALLEQGLQSYPNCPVGWLCLVKVQLALHDYRTAEKSASKGIKYIGSVGEEIQRNRLNRLLRLKQADALCNQGSSKAAQAKTILEEILLANEEDLEVLTSLGETMLVLGDTKQATEYCNKALNINKSCHTSVALQGKISLADKLFDDAELRFLEAIELCPDCAHYYFLLGKLYWEMNGDIRNNKDKCLNQFLKAAKLDAYHSPTFLYLGHYYHEVQKDLSKACRCYQKAYDLEPQCDEAGSHLGDMLTELGREAEALQLFTNVTNNAPAGEAKWAWIRLGLYHLKHDKNNEAINCFQSSLRADPKDSHCWECLGEAYMSRGSHTAALKSFARASELDSSSVYSLYQIATIKQLLCVYDEAIKEYQMILDQQPGYVPALKGFGETHLCLALESLAQDFNKRAVDHVTQGLTALSRAVESRPNMSCLWKLIGDCCTVINPLPDCIISIKLPENLNTFLTEECEVVGKRQLLSLATSAYTKALKSQPKCYSLWNDLGYSYFLQAKIEEGDQCKKLAERSVQVLKKGLTLQRTNHKLWNTLGVVCASNLVNDPELSQHSFIMSSKTETINPVAWTNLGVLYLKHNKVEPAHEAFKKAQALDPSYTEAWVGQASIAEIIGSEEATDLFRHTLELGSHVEGSIGYAHWICTHLTSGKVPQGHSPVPSLSHLPEEYRRAVTQSSVSMTKYTDRIRSTACAYNMHGLLLEHQCLYVQAAQAFASAVQLLLKESDARQDLLNMVYINHARVLCSLGRYDDAIETYQKVTPLDNFHVICGLALAFYMACKLPESYRAYDQALQLAPSDADKSCVLTAMGMLGYALNDIDGAKAMLFKSSQMNPPCERGLMALCALGLVNNDLTLAGAALGELLKLGQKMKDVIYADICYLFSQFFAMQGSEMVGLRHILKAIHEHPERAVLWQQCAMFIIDRCPDNLQVAMRCAEATRKLKHISEEINVSLHPTSLLGSGALPPSSRGEEQPMTTVELRTIAAVRAAQRALRAHPDRVESWAVLCAAVTAHGIAMDTEDKGKGFHMLTLKISQMTMNKCREEQNILESKAKNQLPNLLLSRKQELEGLQRWTVLHTGYSMMYCGLVKEAKEHCQQALSVYANDSRMNTALHLLKAQLCLCGGEVDEADSILQSSVLSSPHHPTVAWQVLAEIRMNAGSPLEAELCYRKCLQAGTNKRSTNWRIVPLLRLALLALNQAKTESAERDRWLTLCQEASTEVIKIDTDCSAARLIQGISFHLQGNARQARRYLQNASESKTSASTVAQQWLSDIQGDNK